MEKVSWEMPIFLSRLNDIEQNAGRLPAGWKYVLPTEASGSTPAGRLTTAYSWGNDINSTRAEYNWDGEGSSGSFKQTRDVGQYAATWGFLTCTEMSGSGSTTGKRTILGCSDRS